MNTYLSIVVTSRNDSHDKTLLWRMQTFLTQLFSQMKKHKLKTEIIIVEWNPPNKDKLLKDVLDFSKKPSTCSVRIITVPTNIHNRFKNSNKLNLFQFIAKNVGIRRAKGDYILTTNIDILFDTKTINYIFETQLKQGVLYRALRIDIPGTLVRTKEKNLLYNFQNRGIRYFLPWGTEYTFENNYIKRIVWFLKVLFFKNIYTNACGDFTLMHRNDWSKTKGYPEYPYHGVKIDGLLCHLAIQKGTKQRILSFNYPIYHIDHPSSWTPDSSLRLIKRLEKNKIPYITSIKYSDLVKEIYSFGKQFNTTNWGLKNENLHEYVY